jgi:colicin import membrane protein
MTREHYDNGISFNRMIFISLFIHAIVLFIIFFSPSLPSPRWTFGPIYSVHLVNLSEDFQGNKALSAISREINETIPHDRSSILKKRVETYSNVPIQRIDIQKKQYSGVDRAIEDIRKKVASSVPSNQMDDAEFRARMNAYYVLIWSRIKGKWALPQGILPRENINAIIQARILKNGTVVDLNYEKYSGNRYFDESAMKAIKKASPFPPLPEWIKDSSVEVGIRFHSSEFR